MTVKELIEALQKQPADLEVRFADPSGDWSDHDIETVATVPNGQWGSDWKPYVLLS